MKIYNTFFIIMYKLFHQVKLRSMEVTFGVIYNEFIAVYCCMMVLLWGHCYPGGRVLFGGNGVFVIIYLCFAVLLYNDDPSWLFINCYSDIGTFVLC